MASITPRISGLLANDYFEGAMGEDDVERCELDGRTPLDRTIDRIGMGSYQWTLLALCGFGWLADNMWIQTIAIILPRVQQHFNVPDSHIGYLSSAMFAGMMIGAVGWGSCSDILGRSTAFNLTLFFTAIFGLVSSYASTFTTLCIALFFLGTSVGGSMPTDGTLLLEHMPRGKQYLVTALSVFFSFGSVLAAVVGLLTIPRHSCPLELPAGIPCDVALMNSGWKYLLMSVGFITLSFFLARIVFFRLHESPRYLVHAGRPEEALLNLQKISRFNGSELELDIEDVHDHVSPPCQNADEEHTPFLPQTPKPTKKDVRTLFDADVNAGVPVTSETEPLANGDGHAIAAGNRLQSDSPERVHYDSTGSSEVPLESHSFITPQSEIASPFDISRAQSFSSVNNDDDNSSLDSEELKTHEEANPIRRPGLGTISGSHRSSLYEAQAKVCWALPTWIRRPFWAWLDKISLVLSPGWRSTTLLVWAMWCSMALAFTMFNVFLPKLLELHGNRPESPRTLEETMWDIVIYSIGGCPGALLGAYLVESSLGKKLSLAGSTFLTAIFCIVFTSAESSLAVRLSTIAISLSVTTMWAILYGWTPEIFETSVRGTACGTASALSRIGGMIAPLLGGALLVVDRSLPVYASVVIFVVAGLCTLMLHVEGTPQGAEARYLSH